ncbi:response regulator [uncultured Roseobacter sp.]|uniref:response regulator n=1 Tax=uncultured Roseobacter sp. TaxID=114847 RepID=UPI002602C676|nr:response regulator [uncultured Roseobacter sp.]
MNILLVEDNDVDAMMFDRALRDARSDNTVVRARDGVEALEVLNQQDPPFAAGAPFVVLLDINMPRMNGHEFLQELRADDRISLVTVVVVTTSSDQGDIERAYERHASGYLVKPSRKSEMTRVIDCLTDYWDRCERPLH